jgi:hypothetical protein
MLRHKDLRAESAPFAEGPELPEPVLDRWRFMQQIEYRRYRAEMAEAKSANGSKAFQDEMAEIAQNWRDLAKEIEDPDQGSGVISLQTLEPKE